MTTFFTISPYRETLTKMSDIPADRDVSAALLLVPYIVVQVVTFSVVLGAVLVLTFMLCTARMSKTVFSFQYSYLYPQCGPLRPPRSSLRFPLPYQIIPTRPACMKDRLRNNDEDEMLAMRDYLPSPYLTLPSFLRVLVSIRHEIQRRNILVPNSVRGAQANSREFAI